MGICSNLDNIPLYPIRLDVLNLMIFTASLEHIRRKVQVCLDGKWINVLIIEDATVSLMEKDEDWEGDEDDSSDMDEYCPSDIEEEEEENLLEKANLGGCSKEAGNDGDKSVKERKGGGGKSKGEGRPQNSITSVQNDVVNKDISDGAESISPREVSFVE